MINIGFASKKGYSGEKELADKLGGKRIPASGAATGFPNDVQLPNGWEVEVKRRKEGLKTVYGWVEDERENPDCLAFRSDRKQWLMIMTLDKFKELMDDQIELKELKAKLSKEDKL